MTVIVLCIVTKTSAQVAYLASSLFLDHNSELIVLVVNTLQRDLADDNILVGARWQGDAQRLSRAQAAAAACQLWACDELVRNYWRTCKCRPCEPTFAI